MLKVGGRGQVESGKKGEVKMERGKGAFQCMSCCCSPRAGKKRGIFIPDFFLACNNIKKYFDCYKNTEANYADCHSGRGILFLPCHEKPGIV